MLSPIEGAGGCDPVAIRAEASRQGFQLVFEPCGSNRFGDHAWSPDGRRVYFQLLTAHVMDATTQQTTDLPVTPRGRGAWLADGRLVLPARSRDDRPALAVVDGGDVRWLPIAGDATDVSRAGADEVWVWSDAHALAVSLGSGLTAPAPEEAYALRRQVASFPLATRGALHPDGRWLALEHEGEPVAGTNFRPPRLSFVDTGTGRRWLATGFQGRDFEWYSGHPRWGSFVVTGFEGDPLPQANVAIGDLLDRLEAAAQGSPVPGLSEFPALE
jgi:hypothetical protein